MPYASGCYGCGTAIPDGTRRCKICAREHREANGAKKEPPALAGGVVERDSPRSLSRWTA